MSEDLIRSALDVARRYPVFPTRDKKPAISNAEYGCQPGKGGFHQASRDGQRVSQDFAHPNATEIAVPTGRASGLLVVDIDIYKDPSLQSWVDSQGWLIGQRMHRTRSGGLHVIFRMPKTNARIPAVLRPGVDIKAEGGYVCWPPTEGYTVIADVDPQPFPMEALAEAVPRHQAEATDPAEQHLHDSKTDEELVEDILSGDTLYPSLLSLSYRLPTRRVDGRPMTPPEAITLLTNIMHKSAAADPLSSRYEDWKDRFSKIEHLVESAWRKRRGVADLSAVVAGAEGQPVFMSPTAARTVGPQPDITADEIELVVGKINASVFTLGELQATVIPPIVWLVPSVIPAQSTVSLAGTSNVGKTRWLASLVAALAVGDTEREGLPQCTGPITTLWLANEERLDDIKRRLKAVARLHHDITSAPIAVRSKDTGMIRLVGTNAYGNLEIDRDSISEVVRTAQSVGAKLIIFDPYVTLSDGGTDENSSATASLLTKAFLLIEALTGASVLHAHHTPKGGQNVKRDYYRGSADAWRGSGAIYSGLDVGLTLSPWRPDGRERAISWDKASLAHNLSRFIVLDSAKIREGKSIKSIVYELIPQDMAAGEGNPIGVCLLSSAVKAQDAMTAVSGEDIFSASLAEALFSLGGGRHRLAEIHEKMKPHPAWPNTQSLNTKFRESLFQMFKTPFIVPGGTIRIVKQFGKVTHGRWWLICAPHRSPVDVVEKDD